MKIFCIFLCWLLIGSLGVFAQTKVDAPTQIKRLPYLDVRGFLNADGTLAHPNDPTVCNDVAINQALSIAPYLGGYVLLGEGEWWVCSTIYIPTSAWLVGSGWGQPTIFGTVQGTTISASSSFTTGYTGASFSKNWILAINGNGTRGANGQAPGDTYSAQAWNMSVNCNNVAGCGALYKGHANEQSGYHYITTQNFTLGGMYFCGAGMSPTYTNSVCGANSGSQGDGPDDNLQFYPSTSMASTSPILMVSGELSHKGFNNITIAGLGSTPANGYAGYIGGAGFSMSNVHMENISDGFHLGGSTPYCPLLATCNGLKSFTVTNSDLTAGNGGAVPSGNAAYYVSDSEGSHLGQISGGGSSCGAIHFNSNGLNQCTRPGYVVGFFDVDPNEMVHTDDTSFTWTFNQPVQIQNNSLLVNNSANQLVLQNSSSPFPGMRFNVDSANSLTLTPSTGYGNLLFQSPYGVLGLIGVNNVLTGLNMQSLIGAPSESGLRGTFCGDMYWDHVNQLWQIGNIGSSTWSCSYIPSGGGFALTSGQVSAVPTTVSDATFLAGTNFLSTPMGRILMGSNVTSQPDAGATLQVFGNVSTTSFETIGGYLTVAGLSTLNGGLSVIGNSSITGTLSATGTITSNDRLYITNNGASIVGNSYEQGNLQVTGAVTTSGLLSSQPIQITTAGNTDNKGQLPISSSNNSATYNFTGTYSHEPVCVTSLDGGVINAFSSPIISGGGSSWSLLIHTNTNVTATANYICMVTP